MTTIHFDPSKGGIGGTFRVAALLLAAWVAAQVQAVGQYVPPPDASWTADATIDVVSTLTDLAIGATQGVALRDGKVYGYGDLVFAEPRIGVIKKYELNDRYELEETGRVVELNRGGTPLITHPTGLAWHPKHGTFLGDTVGGVAVIYRLDWGRAWDDGNLDRAVLDVIRDDAAVNGCRPIFVRVGGRDLLATADYGDARPEIRLMDPAALVEAGRSSAPGVVVHRVLCGPFTQNLAWDAELGHLTCVQNVVAGRGWRLDVVDLERAVADGRADGPGVRVERLTFMPHDELEGWWPIDEERSIFAMARREDNLLIGVVRPLEPRPSPPGSTLEAAEATAREAPR